MLDLKNLPAPTVVEELSVDAIREEIEALFLTEFLEDPVAAEERGEPSRSHMAATLKAEGNLVAKVIQATAYHSLALQSRVNDAARSMLLQYSADTDLDALGALFGVERPITVVGDPGSTPVVPDTLEADGEFRLRIAASVDGRSVAGPPQAWRYHAMNVRPDVVADAYVESPTPGNVVVHLLPEEGEVLTAGIVTEVQDHLENVRPMTTNATVQEATSVAFVIDATVNILPGVAGAQALALAQASLTGFLGGSRRLGGDISPSGVVSALHVEGVHSVDLIAPLSVIAIGTSEYATATSVSIVQGDTNE